MIGSRRCGVLDRWQCVGQGNNDGALSLRKVVGSKGRDLGVVTINVIGSRWKEL